MHDLKLTKASLGHCIQQLTQLVLSDSDAYRLTWKPWRSHRGLSANAQAFVWHKQIADSLGYDVKTIELMNKRDFGLPVILKDPEQGPVIDFMLTRIGFYVMRDDQQLKVMEAMSITSLMDTAQHKEYRDGMQQNWNDNGINLQYAKD